MALLGTIRNTIANFVGGMGVLGLMLVFNALYLKILGAELFGIVSVLITVVLFCPSIDLGTGRTAGRIVAKYLTTMDSTLELRDAVVTLQGINLGIGLILGGGLALGAEFVASDWLIVESLFPDEVARYVGIIGACIPFIIARNFSISCLNGMKRQVLANALTFLSTLLRGVAGLVSLLTQDDPLYSFLVVQLSIFALDSVLSLVVLWGLLPSAQRRPKPSLKVVRNSWRFSLRDGLAAFVGACLSHGDKVLLSALLPLSSFGPYALISTVASGIGRFTSPFSTAFLPHFIELFTLRKVQQLRQDYLLSTQLHACVIFPVVAVMVAFSPEITEALIGRENNFHNLYIAFSFLVFAITFNNLMHLPHSIQLADGNSTTALYFTLVNAFIYIALTLAITPKIGVLGPAISIFVVNAVTFFLFTRFTNRTLSLSNRIWFLQCLIRPGVIVLTVVFLARLLTPSGIGLIAGMFWLAAVVLTAVACAISLCPRTRETLSWLRLAIRSSEETSNIIK